MADEPQGFLGRWARRKTDVLQGKPLEEPAPALKPAPMDNVGVAAASPAISVESAPEAAPSPAGDTPEPPAKTLSLADAKALTHESDFKPFMAQGVGPEIRNAAMKKLFADPHYNVMDGLDIYIDDYSISEPIPESMLRQMVGAKLLKIFDDEENEEDRQVGEGGQGQGGALTQGDAASGPADNPDYPMPETVAQSVAPSEPARPDFHSADYFSQPEPSLGSGASQHDHANPHLRLQPDHAPPAPDAGRGTS